MHNVVDLTQVLKDMYPLPGTRIKQWVVDDREHRDWEEQTCPRFPVAAHEDNTGVRCSNLGSVLWVDLDHHCCYTCGDMYVRLKNMLEVLNWLVDLRKRPKPCEDMNKLSDQVEPPRKLL